MNLDRIWQIVIVLLNTIMTHYCFGQTQISPLNPMLCPGQSAMFSAISNCNGNVSFAWYVNNTLMTTNSSGTYSFLPSQPANQIMLITTCNENGVVTIDTTQTLLSVVNVGIDAGIDQFVDSGTVVTLQATGSFDSLWWSPSYLVDFPASPIVQTIPNQTTTYMLQAYVSGCIIYDYVTVYLTNVFNIPNTFSPNHDGSNDTWIIPGIENFPNNRMMIMNRFGDLLYESNGYNSINAWQGLHNGKELPDGVYYYLLDLGNETVKKGTISIIR